MILDIERFRFINESMGRGAGDSLLKAIADRLRENPRKRAHRSGRHEHFAIVLPNVTDEIHACRLNRGKAQDAAAGPFTIDGRDLRVAARCGVTILTLRTMERSPKR